MTGHGIVLAAVTAWALLAALLDLRYRRLPNPLTLGGAMIALGWLAVTGEALAGPNWKEAVVSGAAAFGFTLPAYLCGAMAAGDVKLCTAMGLMGGYTITLWAFLLGGLVAGVLAIVLLRVGRDRRVPYGAAMAVGFMAALWFR